MTGKKGLQKAVAALVCAAVLVPMGACGIFKEEFDEDTVNITVVWDGLSYLDVDDASNNAVGNKIKEQTGISVNLTFTSGSEAENLNRIFAAGKNFPDVLMFPYWGGADASSAVIRDAAEAGYLQDFDSLIAQYGAKNLESAFTQGVSSDFIEYEFGAEEFGGKHYILPMHTPYSAEETKNHGYTVYCREDILKDLNVNAGDIRSSQDVYALAEKISAGNYKDINGNRIVTATTWGNGWSYECYLNSFKTRGFTNILDNGDGTYTWNAMSGELDEEVKFMNRFVSSGLFDMSAFSQTSTQALQKHVTGGVGLTAATYDHIYENLAGTLYKTNPEMRYVPLGPILDASGNAAMPETLRGDGEYGFAALAITKDCKNAESVMRYLNYINSEEGKRLAYLGIEGEDWHYVDDGTGKMVPQMTDAYFASTKDNFDYKYTRGINSIYTLGVSRVHWDELSYAWHEGGEDPFYTQVKAMYPVQIKEGTRASNFDDGYSKIETFRNRLTSVNYATMVTQMYTANSEAEALEKLASYRAKLDKGSVLTDYMVWFTENANKLKAEGKKLLF